MGNVDIKFRSDFTVTRNVHACCGSDDEMAFAAWAIPPVDNDAWDWKKDALDSHDKDASPEGIARVLKACMKYKHNSPFEHGLMSVYIESPGVVWWQLTRQRFMSLDSEDFSCSLESGRYKHLDPEFYVPAESRPCLEPDNFKPMRPVHSPSRDAWVVAVDAITASSRNSWDLYKEALDFGVAREIARLCLPNWSLYCDGYVTAKPLTWLQFFSKRNRTPDTAVATFPQYEIEQVAAQCETLFAEQWPITHKAFCEFGRTAP